MSSGAAAELPVIRIGLLWHSLTSGNLGIGALTYANMAIVRGVANDMGLNARFIVMGMRDDHSPRLGDAEIDTFKLTSRSLISPGGFWQAAGAVDCVLDIGAGDSFCDIYGAKRFSFLWLTKMIVVLRKVPLLLSPQTIGPFTKRGYRELAAMALTRARMVMARDVQSLEAARDLAPRAHAALSVDVAFELPFESQASLRGGKKVRVGINTSGLLYREAETGRNRFGLSIDYAAFTRALIEKLLARNDCEVHLITHATSGGDPEDDDGARADLLAVEYPQTVRVANFVGPCEAKSYISGLDFLVAGRMHACIAAFSSGTPIVPVAYSRKFTGLFGMLDYRWLVPVSGLSTSAAVDFVLDALDRRGELAADLATGMAKVKGLLDVYRAALRTLFVDVTARRP
jgi:polysaccharide pyruvyl transferase WcaK-like protein